MNNNIIKASVSIFYIIIILSFMSQNIFAKTENDPIIHIDPIAHSFPPVFEGETVSHDFKVQNLGSADLEIKAVTHQ